MVIDQDTSSSLYHHQADTMAAALCRWLCRFAFFLFSQKKRETKKKTKKTKGRTTSKCKWRFERWWVIAVWIDDGLYKLVLRYSSSVPSSVWYSSAGGEIPLRFDDSVGEMNKYDKKMMISTCSSSSMKKKKGREKIEERKKWRNKRGTKPPP